MTMQNSRLILFLVSACLCALFAPAIAVDVDPDTNCPRNVDHKCDICVPDGNDYGCYCVLDDGGEMTTPNLNTPCPIKDVDPCATNPCANGATCARKDLTDFACNCTTGFGGKLCNETLPKCGDANVKCPNGQCHYTGLANFSVYCLCSDGTRRDPLKNETCPLSPCYVAGTETSTCQNGGTCFIVNSAAMCQCKAGWAGANCTKALKQPLCESRPNICGPGKCFQTLVPQRYFCDCGTYPNTIAKELNETIPCDRSPCYMSNPCQNGGTCSNTDKREAACLCSPQYTGYRCEKQSACFINPCRNQGTCQAFNETSYVCTCPPYFTGSNCEISVPNPCNSKDCGPYGQCHDINGIGTCLCSDGYHHDNRPCEDPCTTKNCNVGVCRPRANATYQAYCSCPVVRQGEQCELPTDVCREKPPCGGGFCRPNYLNTRKYECVCANDTVQKDPCSFLKPSDCLTADCGTQGVCVATGGLTLKPNTPAINYVCSCLQGYISLGDCNAVLAQVSAPAIVNKCGANGKPYPSRNPTKPIGCWCNNGTHVEEIDDALPTPICV